MKNFYKTAGKKWFLKINSAVKIEWSNHHLAWNTQIPRIRDSIAGLAHACYTEECFKKKMVPKQPVFLLGENCFSKVHIEWCRDELYESESPGYLKLGKAKNIFSP